MYVYCISCEVTTRDIACDVLVGLPKPGTQLSDRFATGVNINQVTAMSLFFVMAAL